MAGWMAEVGTLTKAVIFVGSGVALSSVAFLIYRYFRREDPESEDEGSATVARVKIESDILTAGSCIFSLLKWPEMVTCITCTGSYRLMLAARDACYRTNHLPTFSGVKYELFEQIKGGSFIIY